MNIHTDGFQAKRLARETGSDRSTTRRPARPQLAMCWQLRDGRLTQVWRLAEATATTRWPDLPVGTTGNDRGTARRPARQGLTMCWQLRDDGTLVQVWRLAEPAPTRRWLEVGEARGLAA